MLTLLRRGLLVLLAALPLFANAAQSPQQVVQQTVDSLLSDLKANKAAYRADPKQLYAALDRISAGGGLRRHRQGRDDRQVFAQRYA